MKKLSVTCFALLFCCIAAFAQNTINGKVVDFENGDPLPGASVVVKGTTTGTSTDLDGSFSIKVKNIPSTLIVSFFGFENQEIVVDKPANNLKVVMKEQINMMDEVVVIGYGTVRKSDLTGSVGTVKREEVTNSRMLSVDQALSGKIAGVNIVDTGGEPGAGIAITVRGVGSVSSEGNEPLYVIDGAPVYRDAGLDVGNTFGVSGSTLNPLSSISPSDIESIEVLKDASATAIYGSRGANGVVLVTTRSGREGAPRVNFTAFGGVSAVSKKIPVLNGQEYLNYQAFDKLQEPYYSNYDQFADEKGHNWQDELLRKGWKQEYSLSVDGGTKQTKYALGVSYTDQHGLVKNSDYNRFTARARIDQNIGKYVKIGINMSYSKFAQKGTASEGGKDNNADVFQQMLGYRPINTDLVDNDSMGDETGSNEVQSNPVAYLDYAKLRTYNSRFMGTGYVQVNIVKGLTFKSSYNYGETTTRTENFYPANISGGSAYNGRGSNGYAQRSNWSWENILTYDAKFNKKHSLNIMAGYTMEYQWARNMSLETRNYPSPFDKLEGVNIANGLDIQAPKVLESSSSIMSFLGRVNYGYDNRYLITASIRSDGSSKFPKGKKFGYFPSVALAWRISNEKFMRSAPFISDLKLRASYGMTGNQGIPAFRSQSRYTSVFYTFNEQGGLSPVAGLVPGIGITSMENPDLTWETSHQFDVGLDLGLFKNRIQLNLDLYYKKTLDLLLETPVPYLTGYTTTMTNSGSLENKGLELTLNTINFNKRNFQWTTSFNISFNRNKMLDLGTTGMLTYNTTYYGESFVIAPGQPIGTMYGYLCDGIYRYQDYKNFYIDNDPSKGMRPQYEWQSIYDNIVKNKNGRFELVDGVPTYGGEVPLPGSPKYRNITEGDNNVNEEDRTFIGHSDPKFYGGFINKFNFYGFDINLFLQYSVGNDFFVASYYPLSGTGNRNILKSIYDNAWRPYNNEGTWPDYTIDDYRQHSSSLWIEDGSYLKIKELTLGYTIPSRLLERAHIRNLRLFVTGQNLWTFTNFSWFDPEASNPNAVQGGLYRFKYPSSRTFLFGVNINF